MTKSDKCRLPSNLFTIALLVLLVSNVGCEQAKSQNLQTITFRSAHFEIVGDVQIPDGHEKHGAIIIVHGDGRGTRRYYREMRSRFTSAGYATFIWDKPGFGESKGKFTEGKVIQERAGILLEAIAKLGKQESIDPDMIGVWGVSQAGYVIPLALEQNARINFMILVGAPGENGIKQTAYFVGQQVQCEGHTEMEALEADSLAEGVLGAQTYDEYKTYGNVLLACYPIVKEIGFMAGILPEDRWRVRSRDGESFFDPVEIIKNTAVPALVFFGELDKNVDPIQGASAYRAAINEAGNGYSKVVVFPGVDHDMIPCKTGCMSERMARSRWRAHSGYLEDMIQWLSEIEK